MSNINSGDDKFLKELEANVMLILKNRKASKTDKLAAIREGVKLVAIKHKISGGGAEEEGFFGK